MFYEYDYEGNDKYIDTEELLSIPRPIIDNTFPDTYEYEDDKQNDILDNHHHHNSHKPGSGHHKISISEDIDTEIFLDDASTMDDIDIDELNRDKSEEQNNTSISDTNTEKENDVHAEYNNGLSNNIDKTIHDYIYENTSSENLNKLLESLEPPFYSKRDKYRYEKITELRNLYDEHFHNFNEFADFLLSHQSDEIYDRELVKFYYDIFTLPHPEMFYDQFRSDLLSESVLANGKGYMIKQCERLIRKLPQVNDVKLS